MYPMDSFHVSDLNSVDDGVIKHLFPNLAEKDWNLLIGINHDHTVGHFLGLDHAGHTFEANS